MQSLRTAHTNLWCWKLAYKFTSSRAGTFGDDGNIQYLDLGGSGGGKGVYVKYIHLCT